MEIKSLLRTVPGKFASSVILFIGVLASGGAALISCEAAKSETNIRIDYTQDELIKRGEYLVKYLRLP